MIHFWFKTPTSKYYYVVHASTCNFKIERFHSRGQQLCKFIGTKESFYIRKEFNSTPKGLVWYTNMAAISLFWNTNMAAMTSRENAL